MYLFHCKPVQGPTCGTVHNFIVHVSMLTRVAQFSFFVHMSTCRTVQKFLYTCRRWHMSHGSKCSENVSTLPRFVLYRNVLHLCGCCHVSYSPTIYGTRVYLETCRTVESFHSPWVHVHMCRAVQNFIVHVSTLKPIVPCKILLCKCPPWHLSYCTWPFVHVSTLTRFCSTNGFWTRFGLAPYTDFYGAPVPIFVLPIYSIDSSTCA